MAVKLFGFTIKRGEDEDANKSQNSFVEKQNDDGAITVDSSALGGFYNTSLDMDSIAKTESELVTKYRTMVSQPELTQAVDEIVNEVINVDSEENVVEIVLDKTDLPDKVKEAVTNEFKNVLSLLDFTNQGYDIFTKFYVDGRLNYHIIIDEDNLRDGIKELRYIDPRKIKLIREVDNRQMDKSSGVITKRVKNEYYMYSETGYVGSTSGAKGSPISKDSIARITSGIMNYNNSMILGHLHPSIKPLNQLRMLEDATVIYTLTRAPERRIFYIDVGNLPKSKAEQYLRDMMTRHKNKLQYNSTTGEMSDARKTMTMTEDFWFPRRGGERSTEVDTLAGGSSQALSTDENLQYFQRKLYKSLKVPISRLEPESTYSFGRVSEITRDEVKFSKFIRRLRSRFSNLFNILLERQLVLKGIIDPDEFAKIKNDIGYNFVKESYFEELKESEIVRERMNTLREVDEYVGRYYSKEWVRKYILRQSDEDIKEINKQIEEEKKNGDDDDLDI